MKYQQPFGEANLDAPYKDRNTGAGEPGSRVPAAAIEHPQREIMAVITAAGITPDAGNLTQLLEAISHLIDSATGGGETSTYVLMTAARSRLPIYPEIANINGTIAVSQPAIGTVRVPAGTEIIHRGIFSLTSVQQDWATAVNKTYHLRWSPTSGFSLKDLADPVYNPSAVSETNAGFDSTFDDMLVAKVVTNGSNVATIVPLVNRHQLMRQSIIIGAAENAPDVNNSRFRVTDTYNWARRPSTYGLHPVNIQYTSTSVNDWDYIVAPGGTNPEVAGAGFDVTRYRIDQSILVDFGANAIFSFSGRA